MATIPPVDRMAATSPWVFDGKIHPCSAVANTDSAQVRVDGAKGVSKYFNLGDTVQIVAEEGSAPELEGYMTILVDETCAYIPENWVEKDADPTFESWDGCTGYGCQLYENYQLKGKPVKQVNLTVGGGVLDAPFPGFPPGCKESLHTIGTSRGRPLRRRKHNKRRYHHMSNPMWCKPSPNIEQQG